MHFSSLFPVLSPPVPSVSSVFLSRADSQLYILRPLSRGSPRLRLVDILQIKSAPGMLATTRGLWDLSETFFPPRSISEGKGRTRSGRTQVGRGLRWDPTAWDVIYGNLKTTVWYIFGYSWIFRAPYLLSLVYSLYYPASPTCACMWASFPLRIYIYMSEDERKEMPELVATSTAPELGHRSRFFYCRSLI